MKTWKYSEQVKQKMIEDYDIFDINRLALGLVNKNSRVLAAGCGSGREVKFLVNNGCNVTAIDIEPEFINSSKIIEPNAEYIVGELSHVSNFLKPNRFDYVICLWNTLNAIQGFEKRKRFIENIYKTLKDGGKFILTFRKFSGHFTYKLKFWKGYSYYPISFRQINKLFEGVGFFRIQRILVWGGRCLIMAEK